MKALLVVTMIFGVWVLLMFGLARATTTVNFDVGSASESMYSTFIDSLRNAAKDATLECYGIPMLPPTSEEPKYVLVELIADDKTITLIYRRNNLYILGYSDPFNGKCRYHIFKDVTGTDRKDAEDTMCPDKNNREEKAIKYESSYSSIEGKAKKPRSQLYIGTTILASLIKKISGVATFTEKIEAEFLLAAIQMTAEASRFKYIENFVKTTIEYPQQPDHKMIRLETEWGKISKAIHGAKNGIISPPLNLNGPKDESWIVSSVEEIKPYISLLNYVKGPCQQNAILIAVA